MDKYSKNINSILLLFYTSTDKESVDGKLAKQCIFEIIKEKYRRGIIIGEWCKMIDFNIELYYKIIVDYECYVDKIIYQGKYEIHLNN